MFNITNSNSHPTRPGHTVFHFYIKDRADYFEELLVESSLFFEKSIEEDAEKTIYFFGIKNRDVKLVNQKNYLVNGKFRKPLIPNVYFRWAVIAFATFAIGLAIVGYIKT